jgi:hypothetical protein
MNSMDAAGRQGYCDPAESFQAGGGEDNGVDDATDDGDNDGIHGRRD